MRTVNGDVSLLLDSRFGSERAGGVHGPGSTIAFDSLGSHPTWTDNGVTPTLRAMGHAGSHTNAGGQLAVAIRLSQTSSNGWGVTNECAYTLDGDQGQAIASDRSDEEPMAQAIRGRDGVNTLEVWQDGTANALVTPSGGRAGIGVGAVAHALIVRRLTPRECERLQGFPDDYTLIPVPRYNRRGQIIRQLPAKDGPRHKALDNSMATTVMHWLGRRITDALASSEPLA